MQHAANPLLRKGTYHYVLGVLLENGTLIRREQKQPNDFAQRTLTYLESHYAEKLSLETVADELGYNRCYFSTRFKRTFHAGFCDYPSMLRINKSLTLLQNKPISDVVFAVGFSSVQNYYTNFKRIMVCPQRPIWDGNKKVPNGYMHAKEMKDNFLRPSHTDADDYESRKFGGADSDRAKGLCFR